MKQPRAGSKRGGRKGRSQKFYAHLKQMPRIRRRTAGSPIEARWTPGKIITLGEFSGTARWVTTAFDAGARRERFSRHRPAMMFAALPSGIAAQGEDPLKGDDGLGLLLGAIGHEVQLCAAAAREGVMADFAARVAHARRHVPRHQLAATLGAINAARKAALALVNRNAALESAGRKKAAILKGKSSRRPRAVKAPQQRGALSTGGELGGA